MDKNLDLNKSGPLPESNEALDVSGPTVEDASQAALRRGFKTVPAAEAAQDPRPSPLEHVGVGFLGRPEGWER